MRVCEPLPSGSTGCMCRQDLVPDGLGECIIRGLGGGPFEILRADPVIAVWGELLRDWHSEMIPPWITLKCGGSARHLGDVIRVDGENRQAVYRITGWRDVGGHDVYTARWPD